MIIVGFRDIYGCAGRYGNGDRDPTAVAKLQGSCGSCHSRRLWGPARSVPGLWLWWLASQTLQDRGSGENHGGSILKCLKCTFGKKAASEISAWPLALTAGWPNPSGLRIWSKSWRQSPEVSDVWSLAFSSLVAVQIMEAVFWSVWCLKLWVSAVWSLIRWWSSGFRTADFAVLLCWQVAAHVSPQYW